MENIRVSKRSITVLRVMLSGIFLVAGINHVLFPKMVASRLVESSIYKNILFIVNAKTLVIATGVGLLIGGLFFIANRYTGIAAMVLLALLIPITISVQLEGWHTSGPLFKNIAIAGGLLFFILNKIGSPKSLNHEIKN